MSDVTQVLNAAAQGDPTAAAELLPLVYEELRRLAANKMAQEAAGQTLQPTALVHEAWLRIAGENQRTWQNRAHFFASAAEAMRRILIDRARRKQRLKHGGQLERVALDEIELPAAMQDEDLLAVDEALESLAQVDSEAAELIKLRFFIGLSHGQAAEIIGVSRRTADNLWAFARAWLFRAVHRKES